MGKIITVILFLFTTQQLQSQVVMDSVVIFDYQSAIKKNPQAGSFPIFIKIKGFDTMTLDAGETTIKRRKLSGLYELREFVLQGPHYLMGVKIYFPKDSTISIHVKGKDNFRKKDFELDTLLTINNNVPRPLVFWAMLRQKYQNNFAFSPTLFTLTNEDFTAKNLPKYVLKNIPPNFIRYTCNTVTKELVDLWAVEENPK